MCVHVIVEFSKENCAKIQDFNTFTFLGTVGLKIMDSSFYKIAVYFFPL
jgi:hypothetical protein